MTNQRTHSHAHPDPEELAFRDLSNRLPRDPGEPLRVGVAGPIGTGKTTLIARLFELLAKRGWQIGVVTNDVYTAMDAEILIDEGLPTERVVGVATGGCPHTAIRDDVSVNEHAVHELLAKCGNLDMVFIESGGDNLTTTFSRELIHKWVCVIDVAGGDKVPAKGGPGVTTSDLFLINKVDLAPHVGASVERMLRDAARLRPTGLPVIAGSTREPDTLEEIVVLLENWGTALE